MMRHILLAAIALLPLFSSCQRNTYQDELYVLDDSTLVSETQRVLATSKRMIYLIDMESRCRMLEGQVANALHNYQYVTKTSMNRQVMIAARAHLEDQCVQNERFLVDVIAKAYEYADGADPATRAQVYAAISKMRHGMEALESETHQSFSGMLVGATWQAGQAATKTPLKHPYIMAGAFVVVAAATLVNSGHGPSGRDIYAARQAIEQAAGELASLVSSNDNDNADSKYGQAASVRSADDECEVHYNSCQAVLRANQDTRFACALCYQACLTLEPVGWPDSVREPEYGDRLACNYYALFN